MKAQTIENWLKENAKLFARQPIILESSVKGVDVIFAETTLQLKTYVQMSGDFMVRVENPHHSNDIWDFVACYDVSARENEDGEFYCKECYRESEKMELFSSELALWETHSLKPWAEWANTIFAVPHEILLGGSIEEEFTSAVVVKIDQNLSYSAFYHTIIPVDANSG